MKLRHKGSYYFLLQITVSSILFFASPLMAYNDAKMHEEIFKRSNFPSATECQTCHPRHFEEWSVSPHAYAQLSPITTAMQATVTKLTNGTNGDFCIRCHSPAGIDMGEPVFTANQNRARVAVEGVSCVACHRMENVQGKSSGRNPLHEGDIFEPVFGPTGNETLKKVLSDSGFEVNSERGKEGRSIHSDVKQMKQMTTSSYCGSCHDVNHVTGFRLEEAFSEYKSSPAAENGVSCQDCHMGKEPGKVSGYEMAPAAIVGGKPTKDRKHTNHMFIGPDSPVVHPGLFPHNPEAWDMASMDEWLTYDYKAGWGTDDFEDNVDSSHEFPERWKDVSDRYEARAILDDNMKLLDRAAIDRMKILQEGYVLGDIIKGDVGANEINFRVEVKNGTDGHNVPTGFDAERIVFLRVTVTDSKGGIVFKSGDLDPNGDLRDRHSLYVQSGKLPRDKYLFNLQSKFLIKMLRGSERESVLPVNYSTDPLPFLRPPVEASSLKGRPTTARKHRKTIPPLESRWAEYSVTTDDLQGREGPFQAKIQLIAGMVPVNLIHAIQDVGFDGYGMTAKDVAQAVVDAHIVLWEKNETFSF